MHTPEQISKELSGFLFGRDEVVAAWEGGSAATGWHDEYSDLDLAVVCGDDSVEVVISLLDEFLEGRYGIERRFRVPEPAWHGFSQCFYRLRDTPELYYLDAAFIRKSLPDKFTASDRHGNAVVWFEKEPVVDTTPTPSGQVLERSRKLYRMAVAQEFLMVLEIRKALARGRFSEAFPFYFQFVARNLAIMLNLSHRPCRADFGLRYGYRDYPPEDAALVEDLLKVGSISELELKFEKAWNRYGELVRELGALGAEPDDASEPGQHHQ